MCFIGGRTRYEWWFVSLRLTVIEQSTSSQRREGSPHGQGNSFLGFFFLRPEGLCGETTREGAVE